MKKILVLTDFSANSINAYGYAVKMACQLKAEILLLFSTNGAPLSLTNQFQYSQQLHSFAKRYACDTHRKLNLVHTECLISGDPWASLLPTMAEVHSPDAIIAGAGLLEAMESQGRELNLEALNGCPILWIPEKANYQPLQHLVFVTDFTDQDPAVLKKVATFAQAFGARVSAVHFYGEEGKRNYAEVQRQGGELQRHLPGDGTYYLMEEEDMIEGIGEFAGEHEVDGFIIATRDTHITRQYLHQAYRKTATCHNSLPLLSFHQAKTKPCTGSCLHCQTHHTAEEKMVLTDE